MTGTPLAWTPARHRWLQECDKGLVNVHTTLIHYASSDDSPVDSEDVWYVTGNHPSGRRAVRWMSDRDVRALWVASKHGTRQYRVAKLTPVGRRLLARWDALLDHDLPPGTRRELAAVAHTTR